MAASAAAIVSSDLPRALESSQRLAGDRPVTSSALLREIPLDIPRVRGRFPMFFWETLIHLNWVYDIARGRALAPGHRIQVEAAADWLVTQAPDSMVVAVERMVLRGRSVACVAVNP